MARKKKKLEKKKKKQQRQLQREHEPQRVSWGSRGEFKEVLDQSPDGITIVPPNAQFAWQDELPPVSAQGLRAFHLFLSQNLSFPFEATYDAMNEQHQEIVYPVTVTRLVDFDHWHIDDGLICQVIDEGETVELPLFEINVVHDSRNRQLIAGYQDWYLGRHDEEDEDDNEITILDRVESTFYGGPEPGALWKRVLFWAISGGVLGFVLGTITGSMEIARISALVGALLLAALGGFLGTRIGIGIGIITKSSYRGLAGGLFGLILGAAIGATIGAMLVSFVGLLCGAVVGAILGLPFRRPHVGFALGLILGPILLALYLDREHALAWGLQGIWIGALVALNLVCLVSLVLRGRSSRLNKTMTSDSE